MVLNDESIRDYADTLIAQVRASDAELAARLDYSERSVWALESLFRASDPRFQSPDTPAHAREMTIFYGGCYLGETLSRCLGGVWRFADDWAESSLVFAHGDGGIQLYPFQKAFRRVHDGPTGNDFVDYLEGLKTRLAES